jgi:hypothetical protein
MTRTIGVLAMVVLSGAVAHAQEAPDPAGDADGARRLAVDRGQFDAAFDAMLRGDFHSASAGFHAVAIAGTPELRRAATELARLADSYLSRGSHLTWSDAPGATHAEGGISEDDVPTGGRTSFIVSTTLESLYSGIVLIDLLHIDDVRQGTALLMGTTAAGVVGSVLGTRGRTMTGGMADAWTLGMLTGVTNALLLSQPLGLYRSGSNASEKVQALTLASSWGFATAGLVIADRIRPTRGQVAVMEMFGLMGIGSTSLTLAMIGPDKFDGDSFTTITALGLDGGLTVGAGFAAKLDWSNSRARLVQLSMLLGALAGGGASVILLSDSGSDNTTRLAAAITLASMWGGFALGVHLTSDMDPDYRFRRASRTAAAPRHGVAIPSISLAPVAIQHGGGLSLVGSF